MDAPDAVVHTNATDLQGDVTIILEKLNRMLAKPQSNFLLVRRELEEIQTAFRRADLLLEQYEIRTQTES